MIGNLYLEIKQYNSPKDKGKVLFVAREDGTVGFPIAVETEEIRYVSAITAAFPELENQVFVVCEQVWGLSNANEYHVMLGFTISEAIAVSMEKYGEWRPIKSELDSDVDEISKELFRRNRL